MTTLYLRNVPDDVVARLKRLAEVESTSVSTMAIRELAESTRRVDNIGLLSALPHLDVPMDTTLGELDAERGR